MSKLRMLHVHGTRCLHMKKSPTAGGKCQGVNRATFKLYHPLGSISTSISGRARGQMGSESASPATRWAVSERVEANRRHTSLCSREPFENPKSIVR